MPPEKQDEQILDLVKNIKNEDHITQAMEMADDYIETLKRRESYTKDMSSVPLVDAISKIAMQCDGARTLDQCGFNKFDAQTVPRLLANLSNEEGGVSDVESEFRLYKIVIKYRKQLLGHGIDVSQIIISDAARQLNESYERAEREEEIAQKHAKVERRITAGINNGYPCLFIRFSKYDKDFKKLLAVMRENSFKWEWKPYFVADIPAWKMTLRSQTDIEGLNEFIDEWDFKVEDSASDHIKGYQDKYTNYTVEVGKDDKGKFFVLKYPYNNSVVGYLGFLQTNKLGWRWFDKPKKTMSVRLNSQMPIEEWKGEKFLDGLKIHTGEDWKISEDAVLLEKEFFGSLGKRETENKAKFEENLAMSHAQEGSSLEVSGITGTLMPFQKVGVDYLIKNKRCFLADDMGLGKTVQAIAAVQHEGAFPVLIVCPASVKYNWKKEFDKWVPGKIVATQKASDTFISEKFDVLVINYNIVKKFQEEIKKISFKSMIFDESSALKGYKSQRTKSCSELVYEQKPPYVFLLSATPMINRPQEMLSQLSILDRLKNFAPSNSKNPRKDGFWQFARKYCNAHKTEYGWDMNGHANKEEMYEKLRGIGAYIRRMKTDVLKELPEKRRIVVPLILDNRREYDKASEEFLKWLAENTEKDEKFVAEMEGMTPEQRAEAIDNKRRNDIDKAERAEHLVRIEKLKQLATKGKMEAVMEWIDTFMETGEKLIVFANHTDVIKAIASKYGAPVITGATSAEERQVNKDAFQNDPEVKLIVCNIKAGGQGITLTAASNEVFIELDWSPMNHDQAEDRAYRIGTKNAVSCYYMIAEDSIDTEMWDIIQGKRGAIEEVTGTTDEQSHVLADLIAKLKLKAQSKVKKNPPSETTNDWK